MDIERVATVYAGLADALAEYHEASSKLVDLETSYEAARTVLLANNMVEGKNAEQREANLNTQLAPQVEKLHSAQRSARDAKFDLEIARLRVEEVRLLVRIEELAYDKYATDKEES